MPSLLCLHMAISLCEERGGESECSSLPFSYQDTYLLSMSYQDTHSVRLGPHPWPHLVIVPSTQEMRFDPWVRKMPWRKKWQPIPEFLPGEYLWTKEPGGLQSMGLQKSRTWLKQPSIHPCTHLLKGPISKYNHVGSKNFNRWICEEHSSVPSSFTKLRETGLNTSILAHPQSNQNDFLEALVRSNHRCAQNPPGYSLTLKIKFRLLMFTYQGLCR